MDQTSGNNINQVGTTLVDNSVSSKLFLEANCFLFMAIYFIPLSLGFYLAFLPLPPIFLLVAIIFFIRLSIVNSQREREGLVIPFENKWSPKIFIGNVLFSVNIILFFTSLISYGLWSQTHYDYVKKVDTTWNEIAKDPTTNFGPEKESIFIERKKDIIDSQKSYAQSYLLFVVAVLVFLSAVKVYISYRSFLYSIFITVISMVLSFPFVWWVYRIIVKGYY